MQADQVQGLLADYLALQRLQVFRRLVVVRLLVLAAVASSAARFSGLLSPVASALLAAIVAIPAAVVWLAEIVATQRVGRMADHVPHSTRVSGHATDESCARAAGKS
jgi:hypothetical protein